jgi:hypothetical protein
MIYAHSDFKAISLNVINLLVCSNDEVKYDNKRDDSSLCKYNSHLTDKNYIV